MFRSVFVLGCLTAELSLASIWGINVDTPQDDSRPATNFELYFRGDVTSEITDGGMTASRTHSQTRRGARVSMAS